MNCKRCGRPTTSADGVCGNRARAECDAIAAKGKSKPDAEDAVLARVEASTTKPKTPPKAKKEPPAPPSGPIEEFFRLTEALGLDGQEMLDDWCQEWVDETRARALGKTSAPAPKNGALTDIADDYEKAREQAEAAES